MTIAVDWDESTNKDHQTYFLNIFVEHVWMYEGCADSTIQLFMILPGRLMKIRFCLNIFMHKNRINCIRKV